MVRSVRRHNTGWLEFAYKSSKIQMFFARGAAHCWCRWFSRSFSKPITETEAIKLPLALALQLQKDRLHELLCAGTPHSSYESSFACTRP